MVMDYTASDRRETYRYEVLTPRGDTVGYLDRVRSCSLEWSIYATIRGSGSLTVRTDQSVPWQRYHIRPWVTVETAAGSQTHPLMTAVCRIPSETRSRAGVTTTLELHDRTVLLSERQVTDSVSIPAGARVTDRIRGILDSLGVVGYSVTDSGAVLSAPMVWDPTAATDAVSWLRVLNDLAASIGYRGLYADGLGNIRAEPYVAPGLRSPSWRLADDSAPHDRYRDEITLESTLFTSPNDWYLVSRSTEGAPAWTYHTTNDDPAHPFSTVSLGRVVTERRSDVDVSSAAALAAEGERIKAEAMADQRTFGLSARYIPTVESDVIDLVHSPSGLVTRASVTARRLDCRPGALLGLTLREVT